MGIFYVDTSNEESMIAERKRKEEIREIAKATLELAKQAEDIIFPEFLWDIQLNEFEGDDYRLRGTCDNPNVMKAYDIRRKYSDYWDYLDALEAYYDYVEYVDSAYGSFDMMKRAADDGISIIYIPRMPKLSNKKKNKDMMRAQFVPSRIDPDAELSEEDLQEYLNLIPMNEISESENYKLPKVDQRIQKKMMESKMRADRLNTIYSASSNYNQGVDAIINFLNSRNTEEFGERARKGRSFTEEMQTIHEDEYIPDDVLRYEFTPNQAIIRDGKIVNSKKQDQVEILLALETSGFNFLGTSATKDMDKSSIRAITRQVGETINYDNLTPKELRKIKKKEAKRRKREQERLLGDRRMQDTLLRNRAHFSRDDNLNFRLSDVIPQDD